MLGLLELLACTDAQHPGILGASTELSQHFAEDRTREIAPEQQIADELSRLSRDEFNLLLYLVAAHHGKVRCGCK